VIILYISSGWGCFDAALVTALLPAATDAAAAAVAAAAAATVHDDDDDDDVTELGILSAPTRSPSTCSR